MFFLCLLGTAAISIFVLITGKNQSFQLINGANNYVFDNFFSWVTYGGDGLVWILLALYCIFFNKKYLVAVIAGIIISTLLTHFLKRIVYPDELRPINYLTENFPVHVVEGVKMNRMHSFPSGHTATAFTLALLTGYISVHVIWAFALPVAALLVAYSRVYLAQHFVTDVLAGVCVGIISGLASILLYKEYLKRNSKVIASV
jgi:membrane-associated phospholipid phosphatase